jgi:hypothetical protein
MFPEEKRMSARVRFSDGEEPEAQLELEPELANRLFQALLWIQNIKQGDFFGFFFYLHGFRILTVYFF